MSTKSRALFVYRNKNENPPESFLKKACETYPSWSGLAFRDGDRIEFSKDHESPATAAGILSICNNDEYKNKDIIFCLGKEENNVKLDEDHSNLQPFDLVETGEGDKAVTKVIAFIDGAFEMLATNSEPEGRPFLFTKQSIVPYIHSTWGLCGGDVDKFMEQIRMSHTEAMLLALAGKDASIAIMTTATDKPFAYYTNTDKGDEFSWGFVNDTCGWKEEIVSPTVDNKTKSTLKMSTASVEPVRDTTSAIMYMFQVTNNVTKNSDIRERYIKYHGKQPQQYQNYPTVSLLPNKYEEASKDQNIRLKAIAGTSPTKVDTKTTVSTSPTQTASQVDDAVAKEKLKKFVDANVLQVMSPEDMAKNELPLPTFWDQTGWKLEDFVNATNKKEIIDKLFISGYKDATTMLINDLCYAIFRLNADLEQATKPKTETIVTASPPSKKRFTMSA